MSVNGYRLFFKSTKLRKPCIAGAINTHINNHELHQNHQNISLTSVRWTSLSKTNVHFMTEILSLTGIADGPYTAYQTDKDPD